jgi:TctA family transporter
VNSSTFLILMMAGFALLGYIFAKLGCEGAPFLLGFVLGPLMEENLRRAMMIAQGDASIFFSRPISAGFLIAAVILLAAIAAPTLRAKREEVLQE